MDLLVWFTIQIVSVLKKWRNNMEEYIHSRTGKPYSLISEKLLVKQDGVWSNEFVLYKAEYPNEDGPFFVRTKDDFFNHFEKVKE